MILLRALDGRVHRVVRGILVMHRGRLTHAPTTYCAREVVHPTNQRIVAGHLGVLTGQRDDTLTAITCLECLAHDD